MAGHPALAPVLLDLWKRWDERLEVLDNACPCDRRMILPYAQDTFGIATIAETFDAASREAD